MSLNHGLFDLFKFPAPTNNLIGKFELIQEQAEQIPLKSTKTRKKCLKKERG